MTNRIHRIGIPFLFLIAILVILPMKVVIAAPDLKVTVDEGLDKKAKEGKATPFVFTIENKGTAFKGDLVVDTVPGEAGGVGQSIPIEIGEGETQTLTMVLDSIVDPNQYGLSEKKNIFFYEGGWKSGKEIPHAGKQLVASTIFPIDSFFIAGLSENYDRLAAFQQLLLQETNGTFFLNLTTLEPSELPSKALAWDAVNLLVVDDYSIKDLPLAQQDAILEWVKSGGTLLVGSTETVADDIGPFSSMLPLKLIESVELAPALFNDSFKEPIAGFSSELEPDAEVLVEKDGTILVATKPVGSGSVMQTAFSTGNESFRSSPGAKPFLTGVLNTSIQSNRDYNAQGFYGNPTEDLTYRVGEMNEIFPSFKVSTSFLFGIIIFYILLVIPLLYFLLRKRDKREHAWWIIPVIAVLLSIAIFAYGGKGRFGTAQLQHSAVYMIGEDERLSGYFAEALLTDKGGNYTFSIQQPSKVFVKSSASSIFGSSTLAYHNVIVEKQDEQQMLSFRNLGYWNVASIYGQTQLEGIGMIETDLHLENNQLTGTITNNYEFPMKELVLLSGSKKIELGSVKAGETIDIDKEVKATVLSRRATNQDEFWGQEISSDADLMDERKQGLLSFSAIHMNRSDKPILAAVTETQILDLSLNERKVNTSPLSVLLQPIDIDTKLTDTFTVDDEILSMELVSPIGVPADLMDVGTKEYIFTDKEYTQTWHLPKDMIDKVSQWTELELFNMDFNRYSASIMNVKTNRYEPLEGESIQKFKPADDYVSQKGRVQVQLRLQDSQLEDVAHPPELRLTGEVTK